MTSDFYSRGHFIYPFSTKYCIPILFTEQLFMFRPDRDSGLRSRCDGELGPDHLQGDLAPVAAEPVQCKGLHISTNILHTTATTYVQLAEFNKGSFYGEANEI